ncbi:amidohydrolase family protein [Sphingomonas sp. BK345]|uniref:N-acyl-D-amino-acid deacylase family protein n=1 Tax=Sphingomonas sp. BK345 TaxID=2586980 RepID=UPI00161CD5D7|nr:N-acyl-D-aspartate/D-glutamate deacylase [Sphingomonas sp. BK345]
MRRALLALLLVGAAPAVAPALPDVAIRGGTVYTGADAPPFRGDVEVTGDRISYVGPSRRGAARRVIDARGKLVTPGLIDAHTHPDTYLRSPDAAVRTNVAWLAQGVTTIVTGVDGYGTPDVVADARALAAKGIGTNTVPFVGFGAVRRRVLGASARAPDADELAKMRALVAGAMCQGAAGFSTGLFYAPQRYASTEEVIAVAREAGSRGGLYDTHQRDESDYSIGLMASTREALRIGREAAMPVHIAHLKALGVAVHGQAPALVALIEAARRAGQDVTADQYPWLASGSAVDAALVPGWALDGGYRAMIARLADLAAMARIRPEMQANLRRRGGAASLLLTSAGQPWTGRTLAQVAAAWRVDPIDAALRILRVPNAARTDPAGAAVASFNMVDRDVDLIMRQPWVVTSSDGSDGHPRQFATFPRKYQAYVRQRRVITLADFVRRSTGATADIYRLAGRGYLRAGYAADVAVIDPARYAPRADYLHPRVPSAGVAAVLVNGRVALLNGRATGALAGRVLLRAPPRGC